MKYSLVTTMSKGGYEVYGRRMLKSVEAHWPKEVAFHVFYEGRPEYPSERINWHSLDADEDRAKFMRDYKDREDTPGDYRYRVVRYSHKVWAMTGAPRDAHHLMFLDADTETVAPIPLEALKDFCADDGQCGAFLARPYFRHTETGFIAFNLKCRGDYFLSDLRDFYKRGEVATLPEWHDCMAFDFLRRRYERAGHRFKNLCPTAEGLNVFEHSPLGKYIKHNKGPAAKKREYGNAMVNEVLRESV